MSESKPQSRKAAGRAPRAMTFPGQWLSLAEAAADTGLPPAI